ncbi:MAG: septum formation protein Maf [Bacteroidetes bacterium]|jgi:septum formation protein|nr:septum formation protein Maf [Bacteroidota bacterium]MBT3749111.1 septum formation protein Maf [Bacteroidota bacterium]MBT4399698.1 septum formation protein Maf [Bacteroidota bacterium]MBT5428271.1 septum formation protein Maf [Bacteroidota bacterium]MBT7463121.1 septum formation protein Maf [Bacteroidota bacterium]
MESFLSHLETYRIFLGSRSPRRSELLKQLGIPFELWLKEDNPEIIPDGYTGEKAACFLAAQKADPYENDLKEDDILITADTIVLNDQDILGKPASKKEAKDMLLSLSDKRHKVITGVCLKSKWRQHCFYVMTKVDFAAITIEDIEYYIKKFKPMDKAGSYGIQEWIGLVGVRSIEGSYFNVMGLPVQRLYLEIKSFTNFQNK